MTRSAGSSTRRNARVRCAIYTRKSSEEGLEQEFNSLQAQREACEAFITSQLHEGWVCLPAVYDDGGFSGATMDRPALQRLLADITAGRVDIVVVYKIDRLTRSLADFAKIVEILDTRSTSFVSVTQQFNTTTSMGRLTLNVLLSFAQFEREVIGERIRDKIAASKKKGMWMGGVPPLGYRVQDRKLVIIDSEAELVRSIFRRYAELGSVRLLKAELDAQGRTSKSWTSAADRVIGGKPFSRGALYLILQNRTYLGEIVHEGLSHPGEHVPIIDQPLWDAVQAQLAENTADCNSGPRTRQPSLLTGMLFDRDGNRMTASHAVKKGDQPSTPMASRSRQHLPGDTAFRCICPAPTGRARRGNRQELARVARSTTARLLDHPDRAHRRRSRSDRHPFPPDKATRIHRRRSHALAGRDRRRDSDPVHPCTAAPLWARDHNADRWGRPVCRNEARYAADQAAD